MTVRQETLGVPAYFWVTLVGYDGVGEAEFFEKPKDALGARFFEPVVWIVSNR